MAATPPSCELSCPACWLSSSAEGETPRTSRMVLVRCLYGTMCGVIYNVHTVLCTLYGARYLADIKAWANFWFLVLC